MRRTSAPIHEPAMGPTPGLREDRRAGRPEGESRSAEGESQALAGLGGLVEPPVETSVDVIERVAAILRMGSIHTW